MDHRRQIRTFLSAVGRIAEAIGLNRNALYQYGWNVLPSQPLNGIRLCETIGGTRQRDFDIAKTIIVLLSIHVNRSES